MCSFLFMLEVGKISLLLFLDLTASHQQQNLSAQKKQWELHLRSSIVLSLSHCMQQGR